MTEMLNTADAAAMMGLQPKTLCQWRCTGNGPRFIKLTQARRGPVRYRRSDIEAWIAAREYTGTYQFGGVN